MKTDLRGRTLNGIVQGHQSLYQQGEPSWLWIDAKAVILPSLEVNLQGFILM